MKKKYIYFVLILATFVSLIWFVQYSSAKYKDNSNLHISITSAKMYFEDNASDVDLPYSNNTANFYFDVHNYKNDNYTIQDIEYKISISNNNYTFKINENSATNNELLMSIQGGQRNSDELHMVFERLDTSDVPATEDIEITISTTYPYSYEKKITVTILNGAIEVQGNPSNWTKEDVTLTVVPTTQGTTLTEYSFDGGETWTTENYKTYTENTDNISVYAKDSMNQTIGPVIVHITKIDKTPPVFSITKDTEYEADGTEKLVDTLIVTLHEQTSVLKNLVATDTQSGISQQGVKCYRNGTEITTTDFFTSVGRYEVVYRVADEAGNSTEITREVLVRWPTAGKYVVERQEIAGEGMAYTGLKDGLYKDTADTGLDESLPFSSKYYYTGKIVNNYVNFAGKTYTIINIPVNDDIKLISDLSTNSIKWNSTGTRAYYFYNTRVYSNWINKFTPGRYMYNSGDGNYYLFSETEWNHVDEATFYAGSIERPLTTADTIANTINQERTVEPSGGGSASFQSKVAWPNVSDYLKACNYMDLVFSIRSSQLHQPTFRDYSWLASSSEQWTLNAKLDSNDYWVLDTGITTGNEILSNSYNVNKQYRPVFYLKNNTILSGTGTSSDAFTVQENWAWFDSYQVLT